MPAVPADFRVHTLGCGHPGEQEEQDLRCDQMTVNVEKMRFDIAETQRQNALQQRWETRKFAAQAILAAAGCVAAGVALGRLIWFHA